MKNALWPSVALKQFMGGRGKSVNPVLYPDEEFDLFSVPAYDSGLPDHVTGNQIGSTKQVVEPDDVLLSKIVPHIRRAWIVPRKGSRRMIGSSEWMIFSGNNLHPPFLRHYFLTDSFNQQLMLTVSGVGGSLLRARPSHVGEIPLPLPPLREQKRLAAILDQADAIRRKRQQSLRLTDDFLRSVFLDFFGDPVTNPKGWPEIRLGDVIQEGPQNGLYKPSTEYGSGTPILRIDAFYDGVVRAEASLKRLRLSPEDKSLYLLREGDIVVNRVNSLEYLGKSAIIPRFSEEIVFESNIMRMSMDRLRFEPRFIVAMLQTQHIKRQIKICAKQAVNQASINQSDVKSFRIFEPPMALQRDYVRTIEQLEKLQRKQVRHLAEAETLFQSLQCRAFTGQL